MPFDTADHTFQGILNIVMELACNYVFGGTTIVLGGDFKKLCSMIPKSFANEIVAKDIHISNVC